GLRDVVARYGDRVEVADVVVDEILLDISHQAERELRREDAGVLGLVFLQDVGLDGAPDYMDGVGGDTRVLVLGQDAPLDQLGAAGAEKPEAGAVVRRRQL